jgi:hypothetical protein
MKILPPRGLTAEARELARLIVWPDIEPVCLERKPRRKRRRKPNVARYFQQARKAGEKGVVRVEITDPSGTTITVIGEPEAEPLASNPWDVVSKKHAH